MIEIEQRQVPVDAMLAQEAQKHPGGWVYDIDWPYPRDAFVPPEAVRGSWAVDPSGKLTGEYRPNANHRPVIRTRRKPADYMADAARHLKDEWMVEIDPGAEELFPDIPVERRVGYWYVDASGELTGDFRANSAYQGAVDQAE